MESSLPTFEAFCDHHDVASLSADQEYLRQYEEIVRQYADLASTRPKPSKQAPSAPVAMRWRIVGLKAVRSVASSEALASVGGRQLHVIMPMLLQNLWTDSTDYLETLEQRAQLEEKVDVEKMLRRRTSIATVRTVETSETNPAALSGSTADADKLAEEDIGVLAIQCLKQIFVANNRSQIYAATQSLMSFISERVAQGEVLTDTIPISGRDRGWATAILLMVSRWAPVQDRHVILVTVMETLIRCPLTEESMPLQLVMATMVSSLLSSDVNLIGLSVMDILLGLIQQVLRILQLGGVVDPRTQRSGLFAQDSPKKGPSKEPSPATSVITPQITETVSSPSQPRKELLVRLEQCIGDLATHVYYADQISDMIAAILLRLKPSPLSSVSTPVAAIEDPEAATNALTTSANLIEDSSTDGFFSFDTAKVTALSAIKTIILVATQRNLSGAGSLGRNRVGVRVWEGTQWLLRDPDGRVRKAYVDALLTWLGRELTKADLQALEDKPTHSPHKPLMRNGGDNSTTSLAKRAVSNASRGEKPQKPPKTTFLQLLHLAVYENALQYIDSEPDVILLHVLLVTLVDKLGVNAVKSGLPMIFRLQEDIQEVETMAKVRMGSLCHGYFWALIEKFDIDSSSVGREIHNEIIRRRNKGFWVDMVRLPPVRLDQIGTPGYITTQQSLPMDDIETESLKPFDDRQTLVELIATAYSEHMGSPLSSPATSPGRNSSISHPILGGSSLGRPTMEHQLPTKIRDEMLSEWSKESVIALAQDSSKTVSLNGSKTGTGSGRHHRNFLAVNGNLNNEGTNSGTHTPRSLHHHHPHNSRPPSQAYGLVGGPVVKFPKSSAHGDSPAESDSSRNSITRVDQLKRVLSGQAPPSRSFGVHSDTSSESMVSYEGNQSEFSADHRGKPSAETPRRVSAETPRSKSRDCAASSASGDYLRPLTSNPIVARQHNRASTVEEEAGEEEDADAVPPVPRIPASLSQERMFTLSSAQDFAGDGSQDSQQLDYKGEQNIHRSEWAGETEPVTDLEALLNGIGTGDNTRKVNGNVAIPPY